MSVAALTGFMSGLTNRTRLQPLRAGPLESSSKQRLASVVEDGAPWRGFGFAAPNPLPDSHRPMTNRTSSEAAHIQPWDGAVTVTQACRSKTNPNAPLPFTRQTAYALIEAGILPPPIKLSQRLRGWPVQVLRDWLAAQSKK